MYFVKVSSLMTWVRFSVDGVFARLDELQLQKAIRLSELLQGRYEQCTRPLAARPKLQELLVISVEGCKKMVDQPQGRDGQSNL